MKERDVAFKKQITGDCSLDNKNGRASPVLAESHAVDVDPAGHDSTMEMRHCRWRPFSLRRALPMTRLGHRNLSRKTLTLLRRDPGV
ncbi:hypothetical protein BN12_100016 [Nostocoides japonicum T1-X7]|uniref:Uncharacterized protein n=1 Tax=Nostocoides japonicum T1-X7 TaxID=1194083 RepID=A0A077LTY3_9MICO|nr:hypothetical protein BN12_100016 [Tetrasphaera japonica T1-X7]